MDYHQYFGSRQQRPKGTNMKQALMVMLFLSFCAWLVYQINHSSNEPDSYGGKSKFIEQYGGVSLGRKGTPSWLDEIDFPEFVEENSGNADEREEVVQLGGPSNDVQMQILKNTKEDEDGGEEPNTMTNGDWTNSFLDENGVPPEGNETEVIVTSEEAHMDIVHEGINSQSFTTAHADT